MRPIRVINEFLSNGFLNVDVKEVDAAVNELSRYVPAGDIGEYLRNKLEDVQSAARTVWTLRNDKYWETFLEESDEEEGRHEV